MTSDKNCRGRITFLLRAKPAPRKGDEATESSTTTTSIVKATAVLHRRTLAAR
jgi:hypothetical protein